MTDEESKHVVRVKELPCSVCDAAGPSEAHEIEQGNWWTSLALCADCHRGSRNGIHGEKIMWAIMKITLIQALGITIRRLFTGK